MIKNTIGPWEVVGSTTITNSEHSMTIANVSSWSLTPEQVQEHAQLIAAVPDLLKLVRRLANPDQGELLTLADYRQIAQNEIRRLGLEAQTSAAN